jgi:hypothetical protein
MQYWASVNIHDVYDYAIVEVDVLAKGETESAWGSSMFLAVMAIFCEIFEGLLVNFVTRSVQDLL